MNEVSIKKEPLQIILVENDIDDQVLFEEALTRISIPTHLTILKDGREAINYIQHLENLFPDLIFLDLFLPYMNGLECLKKIRSNTVLKQTPCIILTDSNALVNIKKTYDAGANLYIIKPCDYKLLVKIIEGVLGLDWTYFSPPSHELFFVDEKE